MIDAQASAAIRIKVYLAALLLAISGSYLASEVYALVVPAVLPVAARVVFIAAALVLLCVGSQLAGRAVTQILRLHTRRLNKSEAEPRRVLVFFLSALQQKKGVTEENDLTSVLPGHLSLSWDLDADLRALAEYKRQQKLADTRPMFWSWEQPLRGIHHNWRGGKLDRLILICSHESIQQAHWFTQIVQKYGVCDDVHVELLVPDGHGSRLLPAGDERLDDHFGWNFEDFDEMWRAVSQLLALLGGEGIADREIAIDLTGGPKPATVVAASATIHRELRNQYVCTNPKNPDAEQWEYEVLDYDLVLGSGWG